MSELQQHNHIDGSIDIQWRTGFRPTDASRDSIRTPCLKFIVERSMCRNGRPGGHSNDGWSYRFAIFCEPVCSGQTGRSAAAERGLIPFSLLSFVHCMLSFPPWSPSFSTLLWALSTVFYFGRSIINYATASMYAHSFVHDDGLSLSLRGWIWSSRGVLANTAGRLSSPLPLSHL